MAITYDLISEEFEAEALFPCDKEPWVGIMVPVDENGDIELCDRWAEPFIQKDINVVRIPVGHAKIPEVLEHLDGLLLPGGHSNIHPSHYGGELIEGELYDPQRDLSAFALLKRAYEADLPTLGVCRGMQEMVVAFGGRLSNLEDDIEFCNHAKGYEHDGNHQAMDEGVHPIFIQKGGVFERVFGAVDKVKVNSIHKYGAKADEMPTAEPFNIEALAPDGVVEAISAKGKTFFVGVQAHFEFTGDLHDLLFGAYCKKILDHSEQRVGGVKAVVSSDQHI